MVNLVHRSRSKNELSLLPISAPSDHDVIGQRLAVAVPVQNGTE